MTKPTEITSENLIRALACALAVMRNLAGGYTPAEKEKTIEILQAFYSEQLSHYSKRA